MSVARATRANTECYRQRHGGCDLSHFRKFGDWWVPSVGLGTYLGDADDATDAQYAQAIETALACGCNFLDTAHNYRCQRSERVIGRVLAALHAKGLLAREEVVVCTKGGYLAFDGTVPPDPGPALVAPVLEAGLATYDDLAAGCHCLAPRYLDYALHTSLRNLRLPHVDVYYLHNPEQQLEAVDRVTFLQRLRAAFELLEQRAQDGVIGCYGIATWQGLRAQPESPEYLSLEALVGLAHDAAGASHHFHAIQLPYNLAMPEAHAFANQPVAGTLYSVLEAAKRLGLSVVTSAALLQQRLTRLPAAMAAHIPGLDTNAQRAIQFARSTPGVTTALVGMKNAAHVEENLALARHPLLPTAAFDKLFARAAR